jgi:hypothetical protein
MLLEGLWFCPRIAGRESPSCAPTSKKFGHIAPIQQKWVRRLIPKPTESLRAGGRHLQATGESAPSLVGWPPFLQNPAPGAILMV